jgi:hypothetical protein
MFMIVTHVFLVVCGLVAVGYGGAVRAVGGIVAISGALIKEGEVVGGGF